jgi:hypothetical protein
VDVEQRAVSFAAQFQARCAAEAQAITERNYARIREPILANYSASVRRLLLEEMAHLGGLTPAANHRLREADAQLRAAHLSRAWDESSIRAHAENYSRVCARMPLLTQREAFAEYLGVTPPHGRHLSDCYEGRAKRLACPLWWRRQLRKVWTRAAENAMRDLGVIRKGREPYATEHAVRHRAAGKRRAREFLERSALVNELGEQLEMLPVAERSLANARLRRGEFMCRVRGFEEIAHHQGHVAEFITLTAPSAFHAQLSSGGRNPAFIRAAVREGQMWLRRTWARIRSALKRRSVLVYGFRIAEPHHDATPHWHLLLFVRPREADTLRAVFSAVALSDRGGESGAAQHRVKFERIDSARGSAVGYVAKYVSKNIDGAGAIGAAEDTETGAQVADGLKRVDAWASIHGIRQFQQIGGPPVGLWREARRLREPLEDTDLERARRAADKGMWARFVQCVGGILAGRRTNIRVERVEDGGKNRYGECRAARIVGLRCASAVAVSRPHRWRLIRSRSCSSSHLGPVAITVRSGDPDTWSNPRETSTAGPH